MQGSSWVTHPLLFLVEGGTVVASSLALATPKIVKSLYNVSLDGESQPFATGSTEMMIAIAALGISTLWTGISLGVYFQCLARKNQYESVKDASSDLVKDANATEQV